MISLIKKPNRDHGPVRTRRWPPLPGETVSRAAPADSEFTAATAQPSGDASRSARVTHNAATRNANGLSLLPNSSRPQVDIRDAFNTHGEAV